MKRALPMGMLLIAGMMSTSAYAQEVEDSNDDTQVEPQQPAPSEAPPTPPAKPPTPPAQKQVASANANATGQWVYTDQYGWVWMPYAQQYTYVPAAGTGDPMMYVYDQSDGWQWLSAPWVFGWGPTPYWGAFGVGYFAFHAHPWFNVGAYRGYGYHGGAYGYHGGYAGYHGGYAGYHGAYGGYHGTFGGYHGYAPVHGGSVGYHSSGSFHGGSVGGYHGGGGGFHGGGGGGFHGGGGHR